MKELTKSFGKKFRTCRLRKKYGSMNFSYEEIYSMYGQYDTFVTLDFHQGSEAYNKFGQSLMGTFKYTLEQREELEQLLKLSIVQVKEYYFPRQFFTIYPKNKKYFWTKKEFLMRILQV